MTVAAPIAVIDIGSNSVRLVVYEALSRAPTPIFNEKALCGLGREVLSTGRLAQDAIDKALSALRRFRGLCDAMQVDTLYALATAASRDAKNGPAFIADCEAICRTKVEILTGRREAELAALGVISGIHDPDGVAGDLGGGSLELVDVRGETVAEGITLPLGSLALQDRSSKSMRKAEKIVREAMEEASVLPKLAGRTFYAVGGTWRALARLHMFQKGYPLHVMHGYCIPAKEALAFARTVHRGEVEALGNIEAISVARRPLLSYGALVLENLVRHGRPAQVMISALGVREGLLYSLLDRPQRREDPLLLAAQEFNLLRSRAPLHQEEMVTWTDQFFASSPSLEESGDERRIRHASCLLADVSWRAHPDYRAEQSLEMIAHAAFAGVDHASRVAVALPVYFRHIGLTVEDPPPRLLELVTPSMLDRARILGAAMRVAYPLSAAMAGILPSTKLEVRGDVLALTIPARLSDLVNERVHNRMRQLCRLIGREPVVEVG
ncbi:exopolyphosphatase [Aquabacter sp. CN5-332]|uniref:exopolyphosphatase n=1 Tax=Aquabacter sp. CN5-332 TaxID=3156608 RepID=UPI0032B5F94C